MELLDLPNEVLGTVLAFVTEVPDVLSLRLTCTKLATLVGEFVGIKMARLNLEGEEDPEKEKLKFFSSVGIQQALFQNATSSDFSLCKPHLLQLSDFGGNASPSAMLNLLKDCNNLKRWYITLKMLEEPREGQSNIIKICLPSLSTLVFEMNSLMHGDGEDPHALRKLIITNQNYLRLLDSIDCPGLKIFLMDMYLTGQPHFGAIAGTLLNFLKKSNQLKAFILQLDWLKGVDWKTINAFTNEEERIALEKEMEVVSKGKQLDDLRIALNLPNDPWIQFIQEQKTLKQLWIVDKVGLNGWGPLELGVKNNAGSLKRVYIGSYFRQGERLNFSCFSGCCGLQELILINANNAPTGDVGRDHFDNFNIAAYCPNLELLVTADISISRENIRKILDLTKLTHLALLSASGLCHGTYLHTPQAGCANGVDLTLLRLLMAKQSLHGLLLAGMVTDLSELLQLTEIVVHCTRNALDFEQCVINVTLNGHDEAQSKWQRGTGGPHGFVFNF